MSLKEIVYQVMSFNNTLLTTNLTNNNPDNDTSPYISKENENEGYLYLLVIDLVIFSSLTYLVRVGLVICKTFKTSFAVIYTPFINKYRTAKQLCDI